MNEPDPTTLAVAQMEARSIRGGEVVSSILTCQTLT